VTEAGNGKVTAPRPKPPVRIPYSENTVPARQVWTVTVMLLADGRVHSHLARMSPVTRQMTFLVLPEREWHGSEPEAIRFHLAEAALDARLDPEAARMGW
jgi:hypothetical protein